MKYFLIAGEPSGDAHAAALLQELKLRDPEAEFCFCGGDGMKAATAVEPVIHIREMAFMGFVTVLKNLPAIRRNFRVCKQAIVDFQPDAVILIDYPGFNMRMAAYLRKTTRIPIFYFIPPAVWAWKSYRVNQIKRDISKVLSIFPFEKDFFASYNCEVDYVGHPSVDATRNYLASPLPIEEFRQRNSLTDKPVIALLPGSRRQEIESCLPKMIEAARQFPDYQLVVSGVSSIPDSFYQQVMQGAGYPVVVAQTYQLVHAAEVAVVNSGTATLETALLGTPQVVVYSSLQGRLSYLIKELLLKVKYIAMVNIISDKLVAKELYAHFFTVDNLKNELNQLLNNQEYRSRQLECYSKLQTTMGESGAAARAAESIHTFLRK
jgi:lipid-A-disaccharide synthase